MHVNLRTVPLVLRVVKKSPKTSFLSARHENNFIGDLVHVIANSQQTKALGNIRFGLKSTFPLPYQAGLGERSLLAAVLDHVAQVVVVAALAVPAVFVMYLAR